MELWTNETCCGRGFWVLCCTNRKLLNFVASQAIAVTLVAWNHQLSLITDDFWFVSHYKCLWVWTSFWKAWWKSALWISSPTQHTELSLWMAAARGFSDTQRLLSKSHNRNKNKAWAQNYSWDARPVTSKTPCQNPSDSTAHVPLIYTHNPSLSVSLCEHGTGTEGKGGEIMQRHGKMDRMGFLSHGMKPKPSRVNVQSSRGAEIITNLISIVVNIH